MPVEIYNKQTIKQVSKVRKERCNVIRGSVFDSQAALVVATGKEEKAVAMLALFRNITGAAPNNGLFTFQSDGKELSHPSAAVVAQDKAMQFFLAVRNNSVDPELSKLAASLTVSCASDVNFWTFGKDGQAKQEHKLDRQYSEIEQMPDREFEVLRMELREKYCFPKNGPVRVVWDLATHMVNGSAHTFTDQIEIISQAVDPELLDRYLFAARDNGLLLSSNSHLALIEMLRENGQILSSAILPGELRAKGKTFADLRVAHPSDLILDAIEKAIVNNALYYEA